MINLLMYERLAESAAFITNLTSQYGIGLPISQGGDSWQRRTRVIGGFWDGDFSITEEHMTSNEMRYFFDENGGRRIIEDTLGIITWEGEITQMDLALNGIAHRWTLDPASWHNRVKVMYTSYLTGGTVETDWAANSAASATYGGSEYIEVVGQGYDGESASALRDTILNVTAWPRRFPAGGLSSTAMSSDEPNSLRVYCTGYAMTMNRRYRETDIAAADADSQISTLVGNSEFITTGRINSNTLQVPVAAAGISGRLWDLIEGIIEMGDASGNRWIGGVYGNRKFNYEQAETTVSHYWRKGQLMNKGGGRELASMIKPGLLVELTDTPFEESPPGGNIWDRGDTTWIEEVEFTAPDGYRLIPFGGEFELIGRG